MPINPKYMTVNVRHNAKGWDICDQAIFAHTVELRSNGFQGTNNFFLADFYYGK